MEQTTPINAVPLELGATMAKPLANPWRNRILAELFLRPMSPKHFAMNFSDPELGGPSLSTISRYFRELEGWGLIEVSEELRGGRRRGAVEKIYRATKRIHFDTPTWATLPSYLRSECSASVIMHLIEQITKAVESGTFDMETDRHLSWKAIRLDRTAWSQLSSRLDGVLALQDEVEAATGQQPPKGDECFLATTALLLFRSPPTPTETVPSPEPPTVDRWDPREGQHFLMRAETAKALADPTRNGILGELNLRPMSPNQFFEEFGGTDLPTTARHFRQLKNWGYLEIAEELRGGKRRGGVEKVYRAARRARFSTPSWENLSLDMRIACSVTTLDALFRRINEAFAADTFDAEADRFLTWKTGYFTRPGWKRYGKELDDVLDWVGILESESAKRLSDGGEEISATVGLLSFRSPDGTSTQTT